MSQVQKSLALITPILEINHPQIYDLMINSYLGNVSYQGDDSWGEYIYIEMNKDLPKSLQKELRNHSWYENEYHEENSIVFIFKIDEQTKKTIVDPFLQGKYSKIDREYVDTNFKYYDKGKLSVNYRICNKDKNIKKSWEKKIGMELPEDAEVWSRPRKEDEIIGYKEYTEHIKEQQLNLC